MKQLINKSFYRYETGELPVIFKVIESVKDVDKNDYLLTVERYILKNYNVEKMDEYNVWLKFTLEDDGFKEVTQETIKGIKKKYGVKKGLHKLFKVEV